MVLGDLGSSLQDALEKVAGRSRIDEEAVEEVVRDIQRALLQADVDVTLVNELSDSIRERALNEEPPTGTSPREHVLRIVYEEMVAVVGDATEFDLEEQTILLAGLQGSGKTTTSAKMARWFSRKGLRPAVVQTDTFRPGAYDQSKEMTERAEVPFYGDPDSDDPVEIARKGLEEFEDRDVVIVDTAGRHALEDDLVAEIEEIEGVVQPDMSLLVLDASIGQSAKEQADAFDDAVGIDGVIITKLDGTAKGGGALTAVHQTDSSIAFIGTGEEVNDIERFDPDGFISRLLGMGDIRALVDRVEEAMHETDVDEEELDPEKLLSGDFTLRDVYKQMEAMSNMGRLDQVMDMLPGMGGMGNIKDEMPDDFAEVTEKRMDKFKAVMDSMTDEELDDPSRVGASEVRRIARGSGTSEDDVRELLEYYNTMEQTMSQLGGGRDMERMMQKMGDMDGMGGGNMPF
ncbi:MAG: signal recognition particle protein Srp54 [Halobacteriales archaeon]|nr:signal recognition particle protein Srp54 [Halobacteriales archaeon]